MDSRRSSASSAADPELIRVPTQNITITKERLKNGGRGPTINREMSRPSHGGSAHTSGMTTPTNAKPPKVLSEAAMKVSASLLSHNDRLNESPDRLGSVFNAEFSNLASTKKSPRVPETSPDELLLAQPPISAPVNPLLNSRRVTETPSLPSAPKQAVEPSQPAFPVHNPGTSDSSKEVSELRKLTAQLEGRVEVLSSEAEVAIKERAKYQSELGILSSKLKLATQEQTSRNRSAIDDQISKLQKAQDALQQQLTDTERQLEGKRSEAARLSDNLQSTQGLNSRLQAAISSSGQELKAKDQELIKLTSTLKSLQVQLLSVTDEKQMSLDRISSLSDDVKSLTDTKEWYQVQLHSAQELRSSLQTELTKLQNLVSIQADALERVKVESAQLRHQLSDTQHKALAEKQLLIRHLEAIEADMLEREAGFEQLEKEKGLSEYTWQQKMMQIEKERMALSKLMTESSDLQRELQKAEHDLRAKSAQVEVLETQQDELNRRLTVAQEAEQVTSRELEMTRERLVESETQLRKLQKQDKERGSLLQSLKQEKAAMQASLNSALEEKKSFAKATEALKLNTAKVEQNFKVMKQELGEKTQKVFELEKEKAALVHKLQAAETVQTATHAGVPSDEHVRLQQEHSVLQEHMAALRHNYEDAEDRAERLIVEKRTLEQQLTNMKSNAAELEHILQKGHTEKAIVEEKLREALATVEEQNKLRKSDSNLQQKYNAQQMKVEQAQQAMQKVELSIKERIADHNTAINFISNQLKQAIAERDAARQQLRAHEESVQASSSSQQEHLYAQIQALRSQLEATQLQKSDLEKQITTYHSGVESTVKEYERRLQISTAALSQCQQQLALERAECEASISRHRAECDNSLKISMELEKERGRLAALKEQHNKAKQHTSELESALGQRESALVQLSAASQTLTAKHDEESEEQKIKIRQLEDDLNKQALLHHDLQSQVDSERQSWEESKSEAERLRLEVECLKQEVDKNSLALVAARSEYNTVSEMAEKQTTNIAMLNKEYRSAKIELEQLRRSVSENSAKNPIICDEMQALQWQVKQKTQEAKDAESQLKLCEQRMDIETEGIRKALADTKAELDCIKLEMEGVRKDKFSYQSRVATLRAAVKDLLKQCKMLQSTLAESELPVPALQESKYEDLLKDTAAPGYKSKPLENLKSCLSGLHSEITTLQQHMDTHKNAIQTNNDSWRHMETEVADLEKLIQASREATKARSSNGVNFGQDNII
ncbi:golgin subfamily A member 3-like [Watersipora subatra]|uniref:golgin subfamily A member 3-like n=1 Tax=Watersipora subatra TaxID=2589382 RepID=UPI00355B87CF